MARRRGSPLHPQLQPSEEGAGVTRRRSPRLHPQIHLSAEEGSGMTRRRSPRLHPQIHPIVEGSVLTSRIRRRRGTSPVAPESLPFNDDMMREILICLPPARLRSLQTLARRPRHRPPLPPPLPRQPPEAAPPRRLQVLRQDVPCERHRFYKRLRGKFAFRPILDRPDRISPQRFDLHVKTGKLPRTRLLGCRHGRALLMDRVRKEVIVCDPITGDDHHIKAPPELYNVYGAVFCAAADHGHVHGSCHSSPFKVVLMSLWGDEDDDESELGDCNPGILVGNAIYWPSKSVGAGVPFFNLNRLTDDIIEFDLDRQSLSLIKGPPDLNGSLRHQIIQAEDGVVGLVILSHGRFEMWQRKVSSHGGATWLLQRTVEIHTILGLAPQIEGSMRVMEILGYDEDNGAIFIHVHTKVYMVQLMTMQFKKLYYSHDAHNCHPFTSFYASGVAIPGGDEAEMLHGA